jgi:hypothetical protein
MIISHGRKYVFVHIPKTGGTSMALALEARAMKDDIMLGDTPKALNRRHRVKGVRTKGRLWKHSTLSDIDGLVDGAALAGMFTFTLVRNPWDRIVSYYHWLKDQSFDHVAVKLAKATDFAGFVAAPQTQASQRAWPSARYMINAQGVEHADAFIRIEHFAQDAAPLFAHLGFDLTLDMVNKSERGRDYRDYYTPQLQQMVADCCADDIARFGYKFK